MPFPIAGSETCRHSTAALRSLESAGLARGDVALEQGAIRLDLSASEALMKRVVGRVIRHCAAMLRTPPARRVTAALLVVDLALVGMHVVRLRLGGHELLSLETDRGAGEYFQYLKLATACVLIVRLARRSTTPRHLAWLPLYAYFLLDDALGIHEHGGELVAAALGRRSPPGWFGQLHGELTVSAVAGVFLSFPCYVAYRSGDDRSRRIFRDLALLTLVLPFFGVVVDAVHAAVQDDAVFDASFGAVEEGGELAAVSLIVGYLLAAGNIGRSRRRSISPESRP